MDARRVARLFSKLSHAPEVLRCLRLCPGGLSLALGYMGLKSVEQLPDFRTRQRDRIRLAHFEDLVTCWLVFIRHDYPVARTCETVVDAGANIGAFSLYAARNAPGARIVALEPSPDTRASLEANIAASGQGDRIRVRPWGLAGTDGRRWFDNRPSVASQYRRFLGDAGEADGIAIETVTLQTLFDREEIDHLDLLKLDVEGAEHEVIRDTPDEVLRRIREIALEYHAPGSKDLLFDRLRRVGFTLASHDPGTEGFGVAHFKRERPHGPS